MNVVAVRQFTRELFALGIVRNKCSVNTNIHLSLLVENSHVLNGES